MHTRLGSARVLAPSFLLCAHGCLPCPGFVVFCSQVAFCLIHTSIVGCDNVFLGFSWRVWTVATLWPVAGFLLVWWVKARDVARFQRVMRRLRIHFDTKLGMYSPR